MLKNIFCQAEKILKAVRSYINDWTAFGLIVF
jgi:hypothetical protein